MCQQLAYCTQIQHISGTKSALIFVYISLTGEFTELIR